MILLKLPNALYKNEFWPVEDVVKPTYEEDYSQYKIVTDNYYSGWGLTFLTEKSRAIIVFQQHWEDGIHYQFLAYPYDKAQVEDYLTLTALPTLNHELLASPYTECYGRELRRDQA